MPIDLRGQESYLSWRQTTWLFILLVRIRWLDWRLAAAIQRVAKRGLDTSGDRFLRLARRWLMIHQAIVSLLGCPEPPHVRQMRLSLDAPLFTDDRRERGLDPPQQAAELRGESSSGGDL